MKSTAIILIAASGIVLLSIFINFRIFEYNPLEGLISLLIPISLLILGITLLNKKPEDNTAQTATKTLVNEQGHQIPSIGDWLVIFLITIIPLVGLIFIIIWANDENYRVRKNYAVATLIWWGITILFTIFLFTTVLSSVFRDIF